MEQRKIKRRPRVQHEKTFQDRLVEEAQRFKEAAEKLPAGSYAQELFLRRGKLRPQRTSMIGFVRPDCSRQQLWKACGRFEASNVFDRR